MAKNLYYEGIRKFKYNGIQPIIRGPLSLLLFFSGCKRIGRGEGTPSKTLAETIESGHLRCITQYYAHQGIF